MLFSRLGLLTGLVSGALLAAIACQAPPAATPAAPAAGTTPAAGATAAPAAKASPTPASNLRAQTPADTLVIGTINAPETLDPASTTSDLLPEPIYHRLVTSRDDKYVGQLADWRVIDPTTVQFTIKPNARYEDGTPVTAEDVKFNFERVMNPQFALASQQRQILAGLTAAEVVDQRTVNIKSGQPDPLIAQKVWRLTIAPKAWVESRTAEQLTTQTNGAGPYRVVDFRPRERLVLERNPNSLTQPAFPKVTLNFLPDASARIAALRSGQIDVAEQVLDDQAVGLEREGFQIFTAKRAAGINFAVVPTEAPFNDIRVRQALDVAVDRQALVDNLFQGKATVLQSQPAQPGILGYNPNIRAEFNPERARQLLAQAGHANGFTTTFRYTPAVPNWGQTAEAVSGMLNRVGIRATIEQVELAVWFQRGVQNPNGNGPMYMAQSAFLVPDGSYHLGFWRSGPTNNRGFSNPQFDQLFAQSQVEQNQQRREQLLQEATKIMTDEKVFFYLVAPSLNIAAYPNVKGLNMGLVSTTVVELISK